VLKFALATSEDAAQHKIKKLSAKEGSCACFCVHPILVNSICCTPLFYSLINTSGLEMAIQSIGR
jgi:hypothetical protein